MKIVENVILFSPLEAVDEMRLICLSFWIIVIALSVPRGMTKGKVQHDLDFHP